jgi:hypothetical protein
MHEGNAFPKASIKSELRKYRGYTYLKVLNRLAKE